MAKKNPAPLPKNPWEIKYNTNEPSKPMRRDGGSSFNPRSGAKRENTHEKINKDDY